VDSADDARRARIRAVLVGRTITEVELERAEAYGPGHDVWTLRFADGGSITLRTNDGEDFSSELDLGRPNPMD